ncbi:MAG: carboxypeptidase regulatory-like domain-containing protein [Planctomycetes bacterium]|nr:carboxypeptidase regulatory-like domain-containing protein [Planctomycetota bacterium]
MGDKFEGFKWGPGLASRRFNATGVVSAALLVLSVWWITSSHTRDSADPAVTVRIRPNERMVTKPEVHGTAESFGSFEGSVRYIGTPPVPSVLARKGDPTVKDSECLVDDELLDESLIVHGDAEQGVQNVFVYLQEAPIGYNPLPVPTAPVVLAMEGCQFRPHALAIRCGQTLLAKWNDPLPHNLRFRTNRNRDPTSPIIKSLQEEPYQFHKSERQPMGIFCDLHMFMSAYFLPLDHPYVAITDKTGNFRIDSLPTGKHRFCIWHERPGFLEKNLEIEVRAGETTERILSFAAERFVRQAAKSE